MTGGFWLPAVLCEIEIRDQTSQATGQGFIYTYSRLSVSGIPRDSLKYFEISELRDIRFAELRKN